MTLPDPATIAGLSDGEKFRVLAEFAEERARVEADFVDRAAMAYGRVAIGREMMAWQATVHALAGFFRYMRLKALDKPQDRSEREEWRARRNNQDAARVINFFGPALSATAPKVPPAALNGQLAHKGGEAG